MCRLLILESHKENKGHPRPKLTLMLTYFKQRTPCLHFETWFKYKSYKLGSCFSRGEASWKDPIREQGWSHIQGNSERNSVRGFKKRDTEPEFQSLAVQQS